MTDGVLHGRPILIVEDEYLLADDLSTYVACNGGTVIGPAATVAQGFALLERGDPIGAAVLDVSLRGEPVFPLADELAARGVPFVFTTGYDASSIPGRFEQVSRCEKPLRMSDVVKVLERIGAA